MSVRLTKLPDLQSDEVRKDLARAIGALFERWGLSTDHQLCLLGMDPEHAEALAQFREGRIALPNSPKRLTRAGYLLSIHKGLRLLYPEDKELRFGWVRLRNRTLDGLTPLDVMLGGGIRGVNQVAQLVESELQV